MTDYAKYEERYRTDPLFYQVVSMFEQLIADCRMDPHELRQAATFAAIRFQMYHVPTLFKLHEDLR